MKKSFRHKFFSIFSCLRAVMILVFAAVLVSCEYYDLPVKAYLAESLASYESSKNGENSDNLEIPEGSKLSPPVLVHNSQIVSSGEIFFQDDSQDYASFVLESSLNLNDVLISYAALDSSWAESANASGISPVSLKLFPEKNGDSKSYSLAARSSKEKYLDSDEMRLNFIVSSQPIFLSSNAGENSQNVEIPVLSGIFSYVLFPSLPGNLIYKISKISDEDENQSDVLYESSNSENGDSVTMDGISFDLSIGTYVVEATLKKSYHKDSVFSQKVAVTLSAKGGGTEIATPSLTFSASLSGSAYIISAETNGKDVTSLVESWEISVENDGTDVASAAGFTVSYSPGGFPSVALPENLAPGTYTIKIKAIYSGETYSDSISFDVK